MRRALAIAALTFWEGVRMRIVLVFLVILVFIVLRLPFRVKGDETLAGQLQTFLSYSLGATTLFLSLATIFLACHTLANEVRSRTLHLVVTKPVSRFQILLGKWLGVCGLNAVLLTLCGVTIYAFAVLIRGRETKFERDELNIRDVIWTARAAANPTVPDFSREVDALIEQQKKDGASFAQGEEKAREQAFTRLRDGWLRIGPGDNRVYQFDNLPAPEAPDTATQVRYRLRGAPPPPDEMLTTLWLFLDPATKQPLMDAPVEFTMRTNDLHQFLVKSSVIRDGKAALVVAKPPPRPGEVPRGMFFEGVKSLEVLFRVGSFEANYLKTLTLIFLRLSFLAAVGLFFGTFTSFPVACFCTLSIFLFCYGVPWWLEVTGANLEVADPKADPYGKWGPFVRPPIVFLLRVVFPDFVKYDGSTPLVEGFYIRPDTVGWAAVHTLLFGAVLLVIPGWLIFRGREVAEVQV